MAQSNTMNRVFITQKIPNEAIPLLEQNKISCDTWSSPDGPNIRPSKEQLIKICQKYDGIISMVTDPLDEEFIEQCQHLKIISQFGAGLNNINLQSAKNHSIKVTNTPDVLTDATAELTLGLIMATARNFKPAILDTIHNKFKSWAPCDYRGKALRGKTLGIFGMGRIGEQIADMTKHGLAMNIIYTSRTKNSELGTKVSFEELLQQSDVISVHCDLNDSTCRRSARSATAMSCSARSRRVRPSETWSPSSRC